VKRGSAERRGLSGLWTITRVWQNTHRRTDWRRTSQHEEQTAIRPLLTKPIRPRKKCCCRKLDDGITLLDVEGGRGVPILQSLVLDHLLLNDGPAFWVDANGHATTATLAQISPSQRLLDRIHVARGFTAYQHYGAVCDLPTAVNKSIRASTADSGGSRSRATKSRRRHVASHPRAHRRAGR